MVWAMEKDGDLSLGTSGLLKVRERMALEWTARESPYHLLPVTATVMVDKVGSLCEQQREKHWEKSVIPGLQDLAMEPCQVPSPVRERRKPSDR